MTVENESAFAFGFCTADGSNHIIENGLTKREYFAAIAMQGLIMNAPNGHLSNSHEGVQLATQWADALIIQLNK